MGRYSARGNHGQAGVTLAYLGPPASLLGVHLRLGGRIFGTPLLEAQGERCSQGPYACNSFFTTHPSSLQTPSEKVFGEGGAQPAGDLTGNRRRARLSKNSLLKLHTQMLRGQVL